MSAMRMTSPPMLLGRKLLKKVATRNDPVSVRAGTGTPCAPSSSPHRHALASTISRYSPSADASHASDAVRTYAQSRGASLREISRTSRPTLTTAFTTEQERVRADDGCGAAASGGVAVARQREGVDWGNP